MDGIFICFSIIIMTFLCYLMTPNNPEPQRTVPAMFYRATSRFAEGYTIPSSNDINTWYKLCNIPFRNYQSGAIGVRIYMTQDYNSLCSPYAANNSGTMEFDLNIDEDIMAVQRQKVLNTNGNICWINKKIITFEIDSGILYISNMSRPIHANYTIMFY
jgi:hypothetical protein